MAITNFDPVSYQIVKADNRTPHAEITLKIKSNDQDSENAVTIDIEAKMHEGETLTTECIIRRDMAYNMAHRVRESLQDLGVLGHGEHAVNATAMFMENKQYDTLFKKVRESLKIDPTEKIDLDRFLQGGD